jgi:hypothetical protein
MWSDLYLGPISCLTQPILQNYKESTVEHIKLMIQQTHSSQAHAAAVAGALVAYHMAPFCRVKDIWPGVQRAFSFVWITQKTLHLPEQRKL